MDSTFDKTRTVGELRAELYQILNFWQNNMVDNEQGGFYGQRDYLNQLNPTASKGAVLNARILWTFSAAYRFTRDQSFLETATRAYQYLLDKFWDKQNGGLFWELDYCGNVVNSRKQIYAQGFGIYGFSEYYRATGNTFALDKAIELFNLVEAHSFDPKHNGYVEALALDWKPLENMRLSPKDANEPKSMNTHLHILEPYTNLLRVWPNELLKQKTANLVRVFLDKIIDNKTAHFNLFFGMDWDVRSHIVSYGHDIEGAWLMTEAAHVLADAKLTAEVEAMAKRMVDAVLAEGADVDGSIYNEKEHDHLDADKHWWPQAEAMVGLAWMWRQTGNDSYLQQMANVWQFIQKHIIDNERGEWFWRVDKTGNIFTSDDKAGFWKCPYHNSRALMEVVEILEH
jgi:mannobiose 2-epimerase